MAGLLGQGVQAAASIYMEHDKNENAFAEKEVRDIADELDDLRSQTDNKGVPLYSEQELMDHLNKKNFKPNRRNKRQWNALYQKQSGATEKEFDGQLAEDMRESWNDLIRGNPTTADKEAWLEEQRDKIIDQPGSASKTAFLSYESTIAGGIATEAKANERTESRTAAGQFSSTFTVDPVLAGANDEMNMVPEDLRTEADIAEFLAAQYAVKNGNSVDEITADERKALDAEASRLMAQRNSILRGDDLEAQNIREQDLQSNRYDSDHVNDVATIAATSASEDLRPTRVGSVLVKGAQGIIADSPDEEDGTVVADVVDLFVPESQGGELDDNLLISLGMKDEDGNWTADGEERFATWQAKHLSQAMELLRKREGNRIQRHADEIALSPGQDSTDFMDEEASIMTEQARGLGLPQGVDLVNQGGRLVLKSGDQVISDNDEIQDFLRDAMGGERGAFVYAAKLAADKQAVTFQANEARLKKDGMAFDRAMAGDSDDPEDFAKGIEASQGYKYLSGSHGTTEDKVQAIMKTAGVDREEALRLIGQEPAQAESLLNEAAERELISLYEIDVPEDPAERRRLANQIAMNQLATMLDAGRSKRGFPPPQIVKSALEHAVAIASGQDADPSRLEMFSVMFGEMDVATQKDMLEGVDEFTAWQFKEFHRILRQSGGIQDSAQVTEIWDRINTISADAWEVNNKAANKIMDIIAEGDGEAMTLCRQITVTWSKASTSSLKRTLVKASGADSPEETLRMLFGKNAELRTVFMHAFVRKTENPDADLSTIISASMAAARLDAKPHRLYQNDNSLAPGERAASRNVLLQDPHGHATFTENEMKDLGVSTQEEAIEKQATARAERAKATGDFIADLGESFSFDDEERTIFAGAMNAGGGDAATYQDKLEGYGYTPAEAKKIAERGHMTQLEAVRFALALEVRSEAGEVDVAKFPPGSGKDGIRLVPVFDGQRQQGDLNEDTIRDEDGNVVSSGGMALGILLPERVRKVLAENADAQGNIFPEVLVPRRGSTATLRYSRNVDLRGEEAAFAAPKAKRAERREIVANIHKYRKTDPQSAVMNEPVTDMKPEYLIRQLEALDGLFTWTQSQRSRAAAIREELKARRADGRMDGYEPNWWRNTGNLKTLNREG